MVRVTVPNTFRRKNRMRWEKTLFGTVRKKGDGWRCLFREKKPQWRKGACLQHRNFRRRPMCNGSIHGRKKKFKRRRLNMKEKGKK